MLLKLKSVLILLLIQFSIQAQVTQEIGVIIGSVHQSYNYSRTNYDLSYLNGFIYKHYDGNSIFRFSAQFELNKNNNNTQILKNISNRINGIDLKFGLEKQFQNKVITPYFATDLLLLKRLNTYDNRLINIDVLASSLIQQSNQYGIGIAPTVGFKVRISNSISLNFETSAEIVNMIRRNRSGSNSNFIDKLDFNYNPINLFSINVKL